MEIKMKLYMKDGKINLLFIDFVIREDICNFNCKYCLSNEFDNNSHNDKKRNEAIVYERNSELAKRLDQVMEKILKLFDAPILRISGGELFAIKNIDEFLRKQTHFKAIQVITNGSLLDRQLLDKLIKVKNCQLHISLDGNTLQQNQFRIGNKRANDKLLANLELAYSYGFEIEVGSVLTNVNTGSYLSFLEYLQRYCGKIKAYPFPIRGKIREKYFPYQHQIEQFETILKRYSEFQNVLPSPKYIEEVINVLRQKRELPCVIPKVMIQLFDNGDIVPCPNCWTNKIGNILNDAPNTIVKNMSNDKIYKLFLKDKPRLPYCHSCMTSLDIINLYFSNHMSFQDIVQLPLYANPEIQLILKEFKSHMKG
ncbi:radical SAM protein [Blautia pseudococcoides]|uniref:Radical SAM core domain-containing protein n=2 Tax=Blautia pseudococcoides TaxID=1796616 RepID=A0A1C7IH40_9FIRM|nr:radical SAM protein [uncultured Blautia sp.]ANU78224.2 hypothetical protein A4V09_22240 [Blautia pseudococcoides]ASU31036.1 radical SAM protein [Blautia pseudococcoides]